MPIHLLPGNRQVRLVNITDQSESHTRFCIYILSTVVKVTASLRLNAAQKLSFSTFNWTIWTAAKRVYQDRMGHDK